MIINTGQRTDIPAFYAKWFMNRIRAGFVLGRNPFNLHQLAQYRLDPRLVDGICFCTKNPSPMIPSLPGLSAYRQIWHVTITPYGRDIEPFVPPVDEVIRSFHILSKAVGAKCMVWRYDPIFLSDTYTMERHLSAFSHMAEALRGYTESCVFSFIDLYSKTIQNFPEARRVTHEEQQLLAQRMAAIAADNGMTLISCAEDPKLGALGVDTHGCLTKEKIERAWGISLKIPPSAGAKARKDCSCLLGHDIGAYNSCVHFCRYCYANYDRQLVMENWKRHDPSSPCLIGEVGPKTISPKPGRKAG